MCGLPQTNYNEFHEIYLNDGELREMEKFQLESKRN